MPSKAVHYSQTAGILAVASDGGLVLPALGTGWESRYTHRFAGPAAGNDQRVQRLLEVMRPYQGRDREASWVEGLAVADRGKLLASWEVTGATGVIADSPTVGPINDFWAFSLWYFPQLGKTYNHLTVGERGGLNDHWLQLRDLLQGFLIDHLRSPGD